MVGIGSACPAEPGTCGHARPAAAAPQDRWILSWSLCREFLFFRSEIGQAPPSIEQRSLQSRSLCGNWREQVRSRRAPTYPQVAPKSLPKPPAAPRRPRWRPRWPGQSSGREIASYFALRLARPCAEIERRRSGFVFFHELLQDTEISRRPCARESCLPSTNMNATHL